jgi:hypothetical protein
MAGAGAAGLPQSADPPADASWRPGWADVVAEVGSTLSFTHRLVELDRFLDFGFGCAGTGLGVSRAGGAAAVGSASSSCCSEGGSGIHTARWRRTLLIYRAVVRRGGLDAGGLAGDSAAIGLDWRIF